MRRDAALLLVSCLTMLSNVSWADQVELSLIPDGSDQRIMSLAGTVCVEESVPEPRVALGS